MRNLRPAASMSSYYEDRLSAERLRRVYEIAPPRIRRHLASEAAHAASGIPVGGLALDLGCGYGRTLPIFAARAGLATGLDISSASLNEAKGLLVRLTKVSLVRADAAFLPFRPGTFDTVLCIQNGISAFHHDQRALLRGCLEITRPKGIVLVSSYAAGFWRPRLEWFRLQAEAGLIGAIDEKKTGNGTIVCKDGFRATTVGPERFRELAAGLPAEIRLEEIDGSSLFCCLTKR